MLVLQQGNTALILAADKGHTEVVEVLAKHKADLNVQDKEVRVVARLFSLCMI